MKVLIFVLLKVVEAAGIPLLIFVPYWCGLGWNILFGVQVEPRFITWLAGVFFTAIACAALCVIGVFLWHLPVLIKYLLELNWYWAEKITRSIKKKLNAHNPN